MQTMRSPWPRTTRLADRRPSVPIKASRAVLLLLAIVGSVAGQEDLQPLGYRDPSLIVDAGVGLWSWPIPCDHDGDGDLDLLVSCPDKPFNGLWFFENRGAIDPRDPAMPIFEPPVRLDEGRTNVFPSYDGERPIVLEPQRIHRDVIADGWRAGEAFGSSSDTLRAARPRHDQRALADLDGDGDDDLIAAVEDWSDYGWDGGYDEQGEWLAGPLRGRIFLVPNLGTDADPIWGEAERLLAPSGPLETFGMSSPNARDWDGDGDLDLLCGEFLDGFTYFRNDGDRTRPKFADGIRLNDDRGRPLTMDLQMIVPVAFDWDRDGDQDLIVGDEDGRIAWLEMVGVDEQQVPRFRAPRYFRQRAADLKCGALATPCGVDWDGDGDDDLVCGNTSGRIWWFENLDGGNPPTWAAPRALQIDGSDLRIQAGPNGSIQGPAEAKWGYTTLTVADWDGDGTRDVIANSIWGRVVWYRRVPGDDPTVMEAARPVEVDWSGEPPKPFWTWWQPEPNELVTQWRTTPVAIDWNDDALVDLVMLDHEGYLVLFERIERDGRRILAPPRRIFVAREPSRFDPQGNPVPRAAPTPDGAAAEATRAPGDSQSLDPQELEPLRLNVGERGKSGRRKLHLVDWNGDGRLDLLVNGRNASWFEGSPLPDGRWRFEFRGELFARPISGHTTSPTTVDFDRDGIPEAVIGAEDGRLYFARHPEAPTDPMER